MENKPEQLRRHEWQPEKEIESAQKPSHRGMANVRAGGEGEGSSHSLRTSATIQSSNLPSSSLHSSDSVLNIPSTPAIGSEEFAKRQKTGQQRTFSNEDIDRSTEAELKSNIVGSGTSFSEKPLFKGENFGDDKAKKKQEEDEMITGLTFSQSIIVSLRRFWCCNSVERWRTIELADTGSH
jgi:hypothetical protein